jgi:predicted RNase H-like HicB family nuclease
MNKITVIIEKSKGGFAAYLPDLPGCVSTGNSIDELKFNIQEAIAFHLEGLFDDKLPVPAKFKRNYILQFNFDVETFLNYYNHIFTRRALSHITGINEGLMSQYAAGRKRPRPAQSQKIQDGLHKLANELLQISL